MKHSNAQIPIQGLFNRFAEELKDALLAMREAESEVEFEMALLQVQGVIAGLELSGA